MPLRSPDYFAFEIRCQAKLLYFVWFDTIQKTFDSLRHTFLPSLASVFQIMANYTYFDRVYKIQLLYARNQNGRQARSTLASFQLVKSFCCSFGAHLVTLQFPYSTDINVTKERQGDYF